MEVRSEDCCPTSGSHSNKHCWVTIPYMVDIGVVWVWLSVLLRILQSWWILTGLPLLTSSLAVNTWSQTAIGLSQVVTQLQLQVHLIWEHPYLQCISTTSNICVILTHPHTHTHTHVHTRSQKWHKRLAQMRKSISCHGCQWERERRVTLLLVCTAWLQQCYKGSGVGEFWFTKLSSVHAHSPRRSGNGN